MSGVIGVSPNMRSGVVGNHPDKPAFYVYGGSGSVAVGNDAVFPFTTAHTNVGGHFDLSQNSFIVPQKGAYFFSLRAYFYGGDTTPQTLSLYQTNSADSGISSFGWTYIPTEISYEDSTTLVQGICNADVGDKIMGRNSSSSMNFYFGTLNHTTLKGWLIG